MSGQCLQLGKPPKVQTSCLILSPWVMICSSCHSFSHRSRHVTVEAAQFPMTTTTKSRATAAAMIQRALFHTILLGGLREPHCNVNRAAFCQTLCSSLHHSTERRRYAAPSRAMTTDKEGTLQLMRTPHHLTGSHLPPVGLKDHLNGIPTHHQTQVSSRHLIKKVLKFQNSRNTID